MDGAVGFDIALKGTKVECVPCAAVCHGRSVSQCQFVQRKDTVISVVHVCVYKTLISSKKKKINKSVSVCSS